MGETPEMMEFQNKKNANFLSFWEKWEKNWNFPKNRFFKKPSPARKNLPHIPKTPKGQLETVKPEKESPSSSPALPLCPTACPCQIQFLLSRSVHDDNGVGQIGPSDRILCQRRVSHPDATSFRLLQDTLWARLTGIAPILFFHARHSRRNRPCASALRTHLARY